MDVGLSLWGLYVLVWFLAVGSAMVGTIRAVLWQTDRLFRFGTRFIR